MRNNLPRGGFTLMEMLLVTTMVAGIAAAIFGAFNNGLKVWARGVVVGHEADVAIGLDKMTEDLRSALNVSQIPFKGTQLRITFPALIFTPADRHGSRAQEEIIDQVGAVEYRFEPGEGIIYRRQANYAQALKKQWGPEQVIASGVDEMRFSYDVAGEKGYTQRDGVDGKIPSGVFVEIRLTSDQLGHYMKRFLSIPVGGS